MGEVISTGHANYMFKLQFASELDTFFKFTDLNLSNDLLMQFNTKEKLNNYLVSQYGSNIVTNNLLSSDYSFLPTFPESSDDNLGGVGLRYGNRPSGSMSPVILQIANLPLPKSIDFACRYANPSNVMCSFRIEFKTNKSTYSLIHIDDDQYTNTSSAPGYVYINNDKTVYKTFVHGTHHFNVPLDIKRDCPNCFTDGETTGNLIIRSAKTVVGYNTNPVYIKKLSILFS